MGIVVGRVDVGSPSASHRHVGGFKSPSSKFIASDIISSFPPPISIHSGCVHNSEPAYGLAAVVNVGDVNTDAGRETDANREMIMSIVLVKTEIRTANEIAEFQIMFVDWT